MTSQRCEPLSHDSEKPHKRIPFAAWFLSVFCWDGLLPFAIVLVPLALKLILPRLGDAVALAALVLPITAFMIRFRVGTIHIATNYCGSVTRFFQYIVFYIGLFALLFVDSLLILSQENGMEKFFANKADLRFLEFAAVIYIVSMVIAMYPGWKPVDSEVLGWDRA